MYGTDTTQVAALAVTGTVISVWWHMLAVGVLIMAGITIITIVRALQHRAHKGETK